MQAVDELGPRPADRRRAGGWLLEETAASAELRARYSSAVKMTWLAFKVFAGLLGGVVLAFFVYRWRGLDIGEAI